ncbi:MAG: carboxymuconolactone decarboxylase family protein, partial [bacterium]|nr:carboxymuconolactone decarboxylase family protein [bacterium]
MQPRLNYMQAANPEGAAAVMGLQRYLSNSSIDHSLLNLVQIRASQINGCSFCLELHAREARASGETDQRLDCVAAWREAPFYTARERAALAWAEALTLVAQTQAPDEAYDAVRAHFSDRELADLTLAIGMIN